MSDFAKFTDDINRTAVSVKLRGEVMVMYADLAPEERDFEVRATRVVEFLTKKGYGEKRGLLAMAIMIRLMALDAILAKQGGAGLDAAGGGTRGHLRSFRYPESCGRGDGCRRLRCSIPLAFGSVSSESLPQEVACEAGGAAIDIPRAPLFDRYPAAFSPIRCGRDELCAV